MNKSNIRIMAYELNTPKYTENKSYMQHRYDHEQIEVFLYRLLNTEETNRAILHNNRMMNLLSYNDSDDSDILEGIFISARYGKVQDIIDVFNQEVTGTKGLKDGVKNEVCFTLDKKTGLLLVQYDEEHVISKEMLHRFFKSKRELVEDYIKEFNKLNKPLHLPANAFAAVTTVSSKEFFQQIREMSSIKEVYVYADIEKRSSSNEAIKYLTQQAKNNKLDDYQKVKISLINNIKSRSVKHVEDYFKKLMELEAYEGYGVVGSTEGRRRQIDYAIQHASLTYNVQVNINANGLISKQQLLNEMIRIIKNENPLKDKTKYYKKAKKVYGDSDGYEMEVATT